MVSLKSLLEKTDRISTVDVDQKKRDLAVAKINKKIRVLDLEDTDKDEPGTQGDMKKYQAARSKVLNKYGVKSCSELEGDEKKACYAALDAAHVSDDEEEGIDEGINLSDADTDAQQYSNGAMSVKKIPSMIAKKGDKHLHLHMKSYHKEKDGQAFAKKHGYKVSNYVKTGAGSRMDLFKEEVELDEMIPKSTMYALVKDGKVIAKGSKRDMVSKSKKEGGKVWNAPSKKVGDTIKEASNITKVNKKIAQDKKMNTAKYDDWQDAARTQDTKNINRKTKPESVKLETNLMRKAEVSGIDIEIIKEVYQRGVNSHEYDSPKCTPEQWGFARVNSFITKSGATWNIHDKDLAEKVRGPLEIGTDEINATYRDDTPGQTAEKPKNIKTLSQKELKACMVNAHKQQADEAYNVDDDFGGKVKKSFKEFIKSRQQGEKK